jgi:hypothetical protein
MGTTKTISAKYLLQQVQSRFKVNHTGWRMDAIESLGVIIGEIGYHTGYEPKELELSVKNFRVKVPSEVVTIGGVEYNRVPMTEALDRDSYKGYTTNRGPVARIGSYSDFLELDKEVKRLNELKLMYEDTPTDELLEKILESRDKVKLLVRNVTYNNHYDCMSNAWFRIESGYIKTSFDEGKITIDADVFMLDDDGLPMVVDTTKYTEACIWGMMYYLLLGGYVHPVVSIQYAEGKKDFFVGQAQNEPKIMSIERNQQFAETWSSLGRGINLDRVII